jgi:hypothetical protein
LEPTSVDARAFRQGLIQTTLALEDPAAFRRRRLAVQVQVVDLSLAIR